MIDDLVNELSFYLRHWDKNDEYQYLQINAIILYKVKNRIEELEAALRRMLIEFDFLIESGHLPDIRRDIIFDDARAALEKKDG